jgi:hypothetical protein
MALPMERSRRNVADGAPLGPIADAEKRHLWGRIHALQRRPAADVLIITVVTDLQAGAEPSRGETTYEFAVPHMP